METLWQHKNKESNPNKIKHRAHCWIDKFLGSDIFLLELHLAELNFHVKY